MAAPAHADGVSRAHDGVSIALLRRLRAGAEIPYVHRADVCSADPADLVANLMPAPGTDQTEDGYNSIWYFYCPKRYKNTQGNASGHRHRAIGIRGETCWHSEVRAKAVSGSEGGTFCSCSYGRKKDGSFERLGWCMIEYDHLVDKQRAATAAATASDFVLCKVYRSSRAKEKPSSSSKSAATSSSCSKRKAGGGNPEARPAKLIHIQREQVQVQVQMQHDNSFTNYHPMPCYEHHQHIADHAMFGHEEMHALALHQQPQAPAPVHYGDFVQTEHCPMPSGLACQQMFGAEEDQGLQQPCAEPEQTGEFIQIPCGLDELTVEDMLGPDPEMTTSSDCISVTTAATPLDDEFFAGVHAECFFGAQEEARTQPSSSSTGPVAPVVMTEVTVEDLFGSEMMAGECVSMPTANTPPDDDFSVGVDTECHFGAQEDAGNRASNSYAPSSSAGCSSLVQEPPLWLPYLMCS